MTGVPVAAAAGIRDVLAAPVCTGLVLGIVAHAVIIGLDTPVGLRVVCLVTAAGTGVPNGVRLTGSESLTAYRSGESAVIGERTIQLGDNHFQVVRTWESAVPRVAPTADGLGVVDDVLSAADLGVPPPAIRALERGLADGAPGPAVDALIGLGKGLTPGGDDVLAGVLTGLHATGHHDRARELITVDSLADRTTQLSADLLRLAAAGHACVEMLALVRALHGVPSRRDVHRLLSIGHTSGADLATGLVIGLRLGAARQEAR